MSRFVYGHSLLFIFDFIFAFWEPCPLSPSKAFSDSQTLKTPGPKERTRRFHFSVFSMLFLFAFSLFTFSAHSLLLRDAGGTPLGVPVGLGMGRLLIHQLVEHLVVERGPGCAGFIPAPILQNISVHRALRVSQGIYPRRVPVAQFTPFIEFIAFFLFHVHTPSSLFWILLPV